MPAARRLLSSRCPECGAPVDIKGVPANVAQIRCAYCGTPLLLPNRESPPQPPPPVARPTLIVGRPSAPRRTATPPHLVVRTQARRKGNPGCTIAFGLIITLIAIAFNAGLLGQLGGLMAQLGLPSPSAAFVGHLYGEPVPLTGGDNETVQDVIVRTRNGNEQIVLVSFDPQSRAVRWRSNPFGSNFLEVTITGGPRLVYVAAQGRLTALDRERGDQVWQTSLANPLPTPCNGDGCLLFLGGYVAALTRDGTVQAFDGETGALLWSRRLNSTPRQLFQVAGQPGVIDTDGQNRATFYMLDRATGAELQSIQPSCTADGRAINAGAHIPFFVSGDGLRLYALGSGSAACAWRYNLVTGDLEWLYAETRALQILPFSWTGESYLIRSGVLYTTLRDGGVARLRAVDSQSGATREITSTERYELLLEAAAGDVLVLQALPTFARNEPELWAIHPETGALQWQAALEIKHPFDELLVRSEGGGLFVGQCLWEAKSCVFQILDPQTGVSRTETRQPVGGSLSGVRWTNNTLWANVWGKVYAVDLTSAQVTLVWP